MSLRIPHPFPLRPDFLAVAELPDDLNAEEAERLAVWVRTLVAAHVAEKHPELAGDSA